MLGPRRPTNITVSLIESPRPTLAVFYAMVGPLVSVSEYEEWPRGRIVYASESGRFIIYADALILRRLALLATIHERFGLPPGRTEAKRDSHYRGARRLEG